jgi:hypothetical protein
MDLKDHAMYSKFPARPGFHLEMDGSNNTYFLRVCIIPDGGRVRGHQCMGENRVHEFDGFFKQTDIVEYIRESKMEPEVIDFEDIWFQTHRPNEKEEIISGDERYRQANPEFPGILSPLKNPEDKPYRLLDGRRRMWKQQAEGKTEGKFYVIPEDLVFRFFWLVLPMEVARAHLDEMNSTITVGGD